MIKAELLGGGDTLARVGSVGPKVSAGLASTISRLVLTLQRNVKADKLSGTVLRVKTGRLRRSINTRLVGMETDKPEGFVGTNVSYARAHEFGFTGKVNIRAHLRVIKQAFGKSIEPKGVNVAGHSRNVVLPERSFLRSALEDMGPTVSRELTEAMQRAVR